jgi:tetratricopeptide (TPR) repeat protein
MSENDEQAESPDQGGPPLERLIADEAQRAKAKKFFDHAKKAADTRNYDYAIKLYVDGLASWPDAIEEGLKKLRVVATARRLEGGKPVGFIAARKYALGGRDVRRSLKNALYLYGFDPGSLSNMEHILQLATKAKCDRMVEWIAPVLVDAFNSAKKLSAGRCEAACRALDEAADLAMAVEADEGATRILEANIAAAQIWSRHFPNSSEAHRAHDNASSKLTIVKGRFARADGFTKSLKDGAAQHDLRDADKMVHTEDRSRELIARARKAWEDSPGVAGKLLHLVDLMVRIETDERENEAIALLEGEYARAGEYVFKQKADDFRMRQLSRHRRELEARAQADPQNAELRQRLASHQARQSEIEIKLFQDRLALYPTDLRVHYLLGSRLFAARRFDDAIPLFQHSQADGRCRSESRLYLGRCFLEKGFCDQAVGTLRSALGELDSVSSKMALELQYWLARGLEASHQPAEARKTYGDLIQRDYNYRDARHRLKKLAPPDPAGGG